MFFRLLKVIVGVVVGFALLIWMLLDPITVIGWAFAINGLIFALCGILILVAYVVVGPQTPEQVVKDDIAVNNIKSLLKNNG